MCGGCQVQLAGDVGGETRGDDKLIYLVGPSEQLGPSFLSWRCVGVGSSLYGSYCS